MEIRIIFPQTASRSVHLFCTARRYAQQTDTQTTPSATCVATSRISAMRPNDKVSTGTARR